MPGPFYPIDDDPLTEIEQDPRMLNLVMRQHKALSRFYAHQAQQYVQLALTIRKELKAHTPTHLEEA